jgi:hypothetical protein
MEAPRSRYRVEERNGRLVVTDTASGVPVSSLGAAPPPRGLDLAGGADRPIARVGGLRDSAGAFLVKRAAKSWDSEGRAVVAWEWEVNGRKRRWDAALDEAQQRRLGRALLAFVNAAAAGAVLVLAGLPFLAVLAAAPLLIRGWWGLSRLQSETSQ